MQQDLFAVAPKVIAPSKYQTNVIEAAKLGLYSILVNALAGSGKTTLLTMVVEALDRSLRVLCLAFNKSIATEMAARMPSGVQVSTVNALGHRVLLNHPDFRGMKLDGDKVRNIAREMISYDEKDLTSAVIALVSKAKTHGLVPNIEGMREVPPRSLMKDTTENWLWLAERYHIELPEYYHRVFELARAVLGASVNMKSLIDFDDQMYLPIVWKLRFPKYDRLIVDEAQDLSNIQFEMLRELSHKDTKHIFVGDRKQSLYYFRGADAGAMDRLSREFKCTELPLSITYRCPKKVVAFAQQYEPAMEAADNAIDGEVVTINSILDADLNPGDMVVCRRAAPLFKTAFSLIPRRIPVRIQGRDLCEGLKALVRQMKPKDIPHLVEKLNAWEIRQVMKLEEVKAPKEKIALVHDKATCIREVIAGTSCKTIRDLENAMNSLMAGEGPCVLLSTVHRVKGLESDNVFILDHGHKVWAKTPEEQQQEINCAYVAVTRAKKKLTFARS